MLIYLGIALFAGFILANQSPINADLRKIVASPFIAASISFLIGTIFLAIISFIESGRIFPSLQFISSEPLWIWLGGLLGAIYLTSNVLLFPRLGALQTVILPILGQIIMGTMIDSFGWFASPKIPMTSLRVIGILILIVGVFVAVVLPSLSKSKAISEKSSSLLFWRIWAIFVGGLSAMQAAINGHLGVLLKAPAQASFVSFFVGFIAIFIVSLIVDCRLPRFKMLKTANSWHYLGGILGGCFVLTSVLAVPQIGAGLTIMMGLIGQILGSMLVQQFGWWRSPKYRIVMLQIVGVFVMLLGIVVIKLI